MHTSMEKAQDGCDVHSKEDDLGLFMLHSKSQLSQLMAPRA